MIPSPQTNSLLSPLKQFKLLPMTSRDSTLYKEGKIAFKNLGEEGNLKPSMNLWYAREARYNDARSNESFNHFTTPLRRCRNEVLTGPFSQGVPEVWSLIRCRLNPLPVVKALIGLIMDYSRIWEMGFSTKK